MSNTEMRCDSAVATLRGARVAMKLVVVVLPVPDVDRTKRFCRDTGWSLDLDRTGGDDCRVIQFTPPGSECSVIFGKNVAAAAPSSVQGLRLVTSDIEAARDELIRRGIGVAELFHDAGGVFHHVDGECLVSGLDPQRASYASYASFNDPDGNAWVLQEVTERLSGGVKAGDTRFTTQLVNAALRMAAAQQPSAVPTPRTSLFVIPTRQQ